MIRAVIVDDQEANCQTLEKLVEKYTEGLEIVGVSHSVDEAYKLITDVNPDLVFLDIEMPEKNGFELLQMFDEPGFLVVFTTAHADYAIKALKLFAFDYLLKPIGITELKSCIQRVEMLKHEDVSRQDIRSRASMLNETHFSDSQAELKKIALPSKEGIEFIEISTIIHCEADRSYSTFYIEGNRRIVVSKPLKEFEELLTEYGFFRVHKSNIANLKKVKKYVRGKGGYLIMEDDSHVPVSVRKRDSLLSIMQA